MKKYLLFAGDNYYPIGGAEDLQGSFESIEDAIIFFQKTPGRFDWAHIFCLETMTIVRNSDRGEWINSTS